MNRHLCPQTFFPLAVNAASGRGERAPPACVGYERKDPSSQSEEARRSYEDGSEHEDAARLAEPAAALGVLVRPRRGRAVLWWNRDADGSLALRSRHVGCPVVQGRKLVATQWMHHRQLPCEDDAAYGETCRAWAAAGECQLNPPFMRASCGRSCGLCEEQLTENT